MWQIYAVALPDLGNEMLAQPSKNSPTYRKRTRYSAGGLHKRHSALRDMADLETGSNDASALTFMLHLQKSSEAARRHGTARSQLPWPTGSLLSAVQFGEITGATRHYAEAPATFPNVVRTRHS